VATLLEQQGFQVVMTRRDEREIGLEPRVQTAERANADIFVSIHANAHTSNANGAETFYASGRNSARLAEAIQDSIIGNLDMVDRGVKQARFYVLVNTSMPAVLVEVGFITGRDDARKLSSPAFRTDMAEAIVQGILQYFR
jgi:N-acetylmuramoyl-L-alanine amidase